MQKDQPWQRWIGILAGAGTQGLFLITVWYLFWYLKEGGEIVAAPSLFLDSGLALQFAVVHSWLLLPATRKRLTQFLPGEFYGCLFCTATCLGLLGMIAGWQASPYCLWNLQGLSKTAVEVCFYGSWILLFYSLSLTGLGYQTGLTPWWYWLRGLPQPKRTFAPRGIYHLMRHPVYFSFMGLIWFTPRMSLDHAVLTGLWSVYIFVGSYLKDERLAYYYGDRYRAYQSEVPGYPLIGFGPLGRRHSAAMSDKALHIADSVTSYPNKAA